MDPLSRLSRLPKPPTDDPIALPEPSRVNPYCTSCGDSFIVARDQMIQINNLLTQLSAHIDTGKKSCAECCRTIKTPTCNNTIAVNKKISSKIVSMQKDLTVLYNDILRLTPKNN